MRLGRNVVFLSDGFPCGIQCDHMAVHCSQMLFVDKGNAENTDTYVGFL